MATKTAYVGTTGGTWFGTTDILPAIANYRYKITRVAINYAPESGYNAYWLSDGDSNRLSFQVKCNDTTIIDLGSYSYKNNGGTRVAVSWTGTAYSYAGATVDWCVARVDTSSYSGIKNIYGVEIDYETEAIITAPGNITAISVSATNVEPNTNVTLSWSGASAGTNNPITAFSVYRATSASGTYSWIGSIATSNTYGSYTVTAPDTFDTTYYYKIVTVATSSPKYSSTDSGPYTSLTTIIRSGASNVWTYKHVLPNGTNATVYINKTGNVKSVNLYYRDSSDGINWGSWNTLATDVTNSPYSAAMPSAGTFRQFNSISVWSNGETSDGTGTCIFYNYGAWTDTLTAGSTQIKAIHMTECQKVARAACRCNFDTGSGSSYTTITAGTTQLAGWTSHVNEVRNALNNTGITNSSSWTTISSNNCSAAIMNELRTKATSY